MFFANRNFTLVTKPNHHCFVGSLEIMTAPANRLNYQGDADTVLVAGAMRSGQTWLCFMLANAFNARFVEPYCLLRGIVFSGHDYVRGLTQGELPGRAATPVKLIVKTHQAPDPHFSLTRKVVLIVRDPRDMVTSALHRYHFMTTTGSDVEEDAKGLALVPLSVHQPLPFKERVRRLVYGNRLFATVLTARRWRDFNTAWRQLPFCHVVRFEDLVKNLAGELDAIARHVGVVVDPATIADTAHLLSMGEIRKHGLTDELKGIGFRKGVVGDFNNHLTRLELAFIRHYCRNAARDFDYTL